MLFIRYVKGSCLCELHREVLHLWAVRGFCSYLGPFTNHTEVSLKGSDSSSVFWCYRCSFVKSCSLFAHSPRFKAWGERVSAYWLVVKLSALGSVYVLVNRNHPEIIINQEDVCVTTIFLWLNFPYKLWDLSMATANLNISCITNVHVVSHIVLCFQMQGVKIETKWKINPTFDGIIWKNGQQHCKEDMSLNSKTVHPTFQIIVSGQSMLTSSEEWAVISHKQQSLHKRSACTSDPATVIFPMATIKIQLSSPADASSLHFHQKKSPARSVTWHTSAITSTAFGIWII